MSAKPRFTDGEKVLCFHGPLLYEAKCLKSQIRDKHMKYFIHYSGWNKNWDEWVPECRVLKYNETNLKKQKELAKTHVKTKKSKSAKTPAKKENEKETVQPSTSEKPVKVKSEKKASTSTPRQEPEPSENHPEPKKKRQVAEPSFIEEVQPVVEVQIDFPGPLKDWLIDDYDLITRQQKLLSLPARVTVDHVIASYIKEKVSGKGLPPAEESTIIQIVNKIRECFNVLLGKMLLLRFERPQYAEMLIENPGYEVCQYYGASHLLRMFTKLGPLLTPLGSTGNIPALLVHLNDFTKFMCMNRKFFFSYDDYIVATPEYHRRAL